MTFTSPFYLILLLLLPLTVYLGWQGGKLAARKREVLSLTLRSLILLALILALAGLEVVRRSDSLALVFLVDVSDSMSQQAVESETTYIREALKAMRADDKAAVVLFGADALVERPMSALTELADFASIPISTQTNLAEAIQLGLALYPSGYAKRMVILSDGAETSGDALTAAKFAAALKAQIVVAPFLGGASSEALLTNVRVPAHIRSGEQFDLEVSIQASQSMNAILRIVSDGAVLYEAPHTLRKGTQTLSLSLKAQGSGFVRYQAQLIPQQDAYYQNNRLDTFAQIEGAPRALVVTPPVGEVLPSGEIRSDEAQLLTVALGAAGFEIFRAEPAFLPADLPSLAAYQSIILVNVPARDLSERQMEALRSYVRDLGGGLVAVGGVTSYGVGGYYGTPLEDALPVDMQIKDPLRRPQLAIVFIIDHSGSMSETSGGFTKLELAKKAAARSVELLFPQDRVGVIAFDETASWVVPMTTLENPGETQSKIAGIQIGGGTDIYAGLLAMSKVLPKDPAKVKHVILLTDGGADVTGIPQLVKKLHDENSITLSTVGVGNDAADFLDDLAELGGGRYHFTNNAGSIPSIFTEETTLASRAYLVEETFFPALVNSSPILANIHEIPPLYGYVATSAKDRAQVILQSPKGDPILAAWQYGLGKSVVFTSDASGRWARDWAQSAMYPTFWAQAARYTINDALNSALQLTVQTQGEQARLTLDARAPSGEFLDAYQIQANIIAPNGEAQTVTFSQTAPGRYESQFIPNEQGVYLMRFSGTTDAAGDSAPLAETTGWALSYSPEYQRIEPNPDLLLRLSEISNGQVASPNPADVFTHDLQAARASKPVAPWLLLLAAVLLPFDIAARRLMITPYDVMKLKERMTPKRRAAAPVPVESSPRIAALQGAKRRIREQAPAAQEMPPAPPVAPLPKRESPPPAPPVESTTSALLARKKNRRK
ncbi:MAG: VWA domain-containing protein [Anaerolineales bacterium]